MSENMIKDTVERLFANTVNRELMEQVEAGVFPTRLWQTVVETGLTKAVCKESHGGIEATWMDAFSLFFQVGYTQAPVPLTSTVIGQYFASRNGLDIEADRIVAVIAGRQAEALHWTQAGSVGFTTLSGVAKGVNWARHADWILVEINGQQLLIDPHCAGVSIERGIDTASLPLDIVTFTAAKVSHVWSTRIEYLPEPVHAIQAALTSAMLTGALEFALDLSVQYAKDRVQFGKPIGKNQAIQQQLAQFAGEVSCSYAAATTALRDLPQVSDMAAPSALFSAAVAKVTTSDAVKTGASIAHQTHGAIGFTYEYPLNFATRRMWAWRAEAGSSSEWADVLGRAFIAGRSDKFWPHLTARKLPQ